MVTNKIFLTLFVLANALPASSFACSCVPESDRVKILHSSTAAFRGRVTSIVHLAPTPSAPSPEEPPVSVKFQILENFKGTPSEEIVIQTVLNRWSCKGYPFQPGEEYVVIAATNRESGRLEINLCDGTRRSADAKEMLDDFRSSMK
jgi:hypothetical protein